MSRKFPKPKKWVPVNYKKYRGDPTNIICRSSWEIKFCNWCDRNDNVIWWNSEDVMIPYYSPVDEKMHRYFCDFLIRLKNKHGKEITHLVEIKPESQTIPPKRGKKREKTFLNEVKTWTVNEAKWNAAIEYSKERGWEFIILSERHLGITK